MKRRIKESRISGELYVLAQRLLGRRSSPRLVVFPDSMYSGSAGDLRAVAVGRELRRRGWRVIIVPPWLGLEVRRRIVRSESPDLILLQQSRHRLNRPAFYSGVPCVFDADDADIVHPDNTPAVAECCRTSAAVVAGNRYLAQRFREFNPDVTVVWTGTYLERPPRVLPNHDRAPILAWAHSDPLGYPDEAEFVLQVLVRLAALTPFAFHLYGVHDRANADQYLKPVRAAGVEVRTFPPMRYRPFVQSLVDVAVGLHPICRSNDFGQGKSFGKLLGYMAADVSVVTSDAVDHPLFFRRGKSGVLLDEDPELWASRCAELLTDPVKRGRMVELARQDFSMRLTTAKSAELVEAVLLRAIGRTK